MSSTVSSRTCGELKDSALDTLDKTGDGATLGTGDGTEGIGDDMKEEIAGAVKAGTCGGTLLGGEPEDSGFVTRKNSSLEPVLFYKRKKKKVKLQNQISITKSQ